jgi:hypothetical protein
MVRLSQEGRTVVRAVRTLIFYIITYTAYTASLLPYCNIYLALHHPSVFSRRYFQPALADRYHRATFSKRSNNIREWNAVTRLLTGDIQGPRTGSPNGRNRNGLILLI